MVLSTVGASETDVALSDLRFGVKGGVEDCVDGALASPVRCRRRSGAVMGDGGIVNLAARGMLVVSVARRLGSEGPLLAYCAAPL